MPLLSLPELVELHERISLTVAPGARRLHRAQHAAPRRRRRASGDRGRRRRDRARRRRPRSVRRRAPARRRARASGRIATIRRRSGPQGPGRRAAKRRNCVRLAVTTAAWLAALALAGGAAAAGIGANDDTGKFAADGGTLFFSQMADLGLKQSVMTVRFLPSDPTSIPDGDALDQAIPVAQLAGLRVTLAVYPYPPRQIEDGTARPRPFAAWLTLLANRYPTVKQYVVMNEPNQPAFLRPQFDARGRNVSAREGRQVPRGGVRRAQGGRPRDQGDRSRTVAARQRPPDRGQQRLDLAGSVSRGARRLVPAERADEADHGRPQLPPVPVQGDRLAGEALPLAERRLREPRPDQAGPLGRLPRHGSADDRERPQAVPRRGRAGRSTRRGLAGYTGVENVQVTDPRDAGAGVLASRPHGHVRRDDRRGEHLRVLRRRAPRQGLPGGAERGRRHTAALRGRGASGDRAVGSRLSARRGSSGIPRSASSARSSRTGRYGRTGRSSTSTRRQTRAPGSSPASSRAGWEGSPRTAR